MSVGNESWVDRLDLEEGDSFENLDAVDQVDVICDAFERQWKHGTRQPVECFLEAAPVTEEILRRLYQELIPLEIEFCSDADETLSFRNYLQRFPDQALFIARFLCDDELDVKLDPPLKKIGGYWLLESVGHGSFGVVYRAYDQDLDRFVAIKLPMTSLGDEEGVRRFQREAKNAGRLAHPGIVPIHFVKQDGEGRPFIVSEFVDGTTLNEFVAEKGRLSARTAASLVAQVAESVEYAHGEGVIHRDLKPGNVILEARKIGDSTQDGTPDDSLRPKVLDFGLARRQDGDASTSIHGAVVGTPAYMSPEQARGDARVDHRADIYSLGAILYELLFGQRCFPGETFSAVLLQVITEEPELPPDEAASVPKDLITICMKCLSKEPADRYLRAADLADDLRRWLRHEEIKARPLSRTAKVVRWVRRNKLLVAGTITTCLLAGIIAFLSVNGRRESHYRAIISSLETALPEELERSIQETQQLLESNSGLRRAIVRYLVNPNLALASELRFRIVLGDDLPGYEQRFYSEIDTIPIAELPTLANRLDLHPSTSVRREKLKTSVKQTLASGDGLHATVCLAALTDDWPGFEELAEQIVDALLDSPEHVLWARALRPISAELLPSCRSPFMVSDQAETVARIVVELAAEHPDEIIWFLGQAQGPSTRVLFPPLQSSHNLPLVKKRLAALSSLPPWHMISEEIKLNEADRLEQDVQQRVNLALCYGFADGVKASQVLGELLMSDADPRPRTYFIQRAKDSIPLKTLSQQVTWERGDARNDLVEDVLYCVILAMSHYEQKDLDQESENLIDQLLNVYLWHPDSGVHCAAGYGLRKLGHDLNKTDLEYSHLRGVRADRDWYHTSFGTCMIVIRASDYPLWFVRDTMQPREGQVRVIPIRRAFAVASTELTQREYALLTGETGDTSEIPQMFTDVLSLADGEERTRERYSLIDTCRLVDEREGLIDDGCFDLAPAEAVVTCELNRLGFRIPVAQEWLVCCSADALTSRYFGSVATDGAGFIDGRERTSHSVFRFLPNRLGFFGMHDNHPELSLTNFPYKEELAIGSPAVGEVILHGNERLTYHGGGNMTHADARMTFYIGPAFLDSEILRTCLRLTQTLPESVSDKED